ncbi:Fc.00g020800.m01.CDS01 [Cosmosporella sp. VM-42]
MTSLHSQSSNGHLGGHLHGHTKITKSRSRQAVKPILKKLQSHSEKNSLDLDRGWEEQAQFGYPSYPAGGDDDSAAGVSYIATSTTAGHTPRARDVSFSVSATDLSTGGAPRPNKYSHARSTSGTSHVSVATSTSGRNGSFVHPFQQTPRASTPPLSYANSLASLEVTGPRDYSPTITEDDDDGESQHYHTSRAYHLPHSHSRPRRPSLASQRTSSLSDINQPLRVTADRRTNSGTASRITQRIVTKSRSDLHLNTASSTALDSASSASPPTGSFISPQMIAASTSSAAMSPLRSSLDMNGFRIRSRSDIDTATRQEQVREARRRFEEKERAKEEKYAREQIRKQERQDNKEASRLHKNHGHGRKSSFGQSRISSDRTSSITDVRPCVSRKNTGTLDSSAEKLAFASRGYDSVPPGQIPRARADGVHFQPTRRNTTTKHKTTGAWTAFVLWLRTRLLKLGRR